MNLSLGTPANNPLSSDPLVRAVNEAVNAGLTVVVAAGNSGPNSQTILSPGNSSSVITVGAVNDRSTNNSYTIAPFSSRGPTKEGLKKPDVVAPGVNINSLSSSNLDQYKALSGTSMATPVVSGCLAILLSRDSSLNPQQLKSHIINSCTSLKEKSENQGAGIVSLNKLFKLSKSPKPNRLRPLPDNADGREGKEVKENISQQDFVSSGLVFMLFLILLLIRIF